VKPVLIILVIHFIADYVCQTDRMAINKSKSIYWLSVHILVYTGVLTIASPLLFWDIGWKAGAVYVLLNGALHFIIDFFTSRLTAHFWKREMRHRFFVTIGFDQMLHYTCLFVTYYSLAESSFFC
jgi:hypothetical protein